MSRRNLEPPTLEDFHIDFDTEEMPGLIVTTSVKLSRGVMRPEDRVRINLPDHPLYARLERFVLANPTKKPNVLKKDG